uniref:Voltage-dependent calcium channel subunit alpha-2/delta-4 n=1 Tax=Castor canadensis TaxID=51338 RepID=A0A8B7U681_CASCN|nr:voltage-dependent calcium channel subunit alpha-2/delta-4 [Castor canadensis]
MYDYQAMCKPPDHHHSAAQPLASPLSAFLTVARWLMHELLLCLLEWSAWGSWREPGAEAKAVFHHSHKHKKQDLLYPCDTEYPVFVHQTAIQEANGIIECGTCQKMFVMQQILPQQPPPAGDRPHLRLQLLPACPAGGNRSQI